MGFSNMMMAAAKSMPKSTISQSIPSLTYSSCSTTNICRKNCPALGCQPYGYDQGLLQAKNQGR